VVTVLVEVVQAVVAVLEVVVEAIEVVPIVAIVAVLVGSVVQDFVSVYAALEKFVQNLVAVVVVLVEVLPPEVLEKGWVGSSPS
jgi:hypothetical protein